MNYIPTRSAKRRALGLLRQPDPLKLTTALSVLRLLHRVCEDIDCTYGDKSAEKTLFITGVQGKITKPNWNRDYTYFLAKVQEVRAYLMKFCVQTVIDDLLRTALEIYNRFDNRRRMGVEVLVLAALANKNSTWFEVPDKYQSNVFVLEMLVSCRHRFQRPEKSYFWSRQSETLLISTFNQARHLTRLKLPIANDAILRTLAANCRALQDLELQFAEDVSEEGLLALAGKSVASRDQGTARLWSGSLNLHKDFGASKEWFIKDTMLFTPPGRRSQPRNQDDLSIGQQFPVRFFDTGFGCKELVKLRIKGDFVFPPLARRYKDFPHMNKIFKGPTLELGFYVLLLSLKKLQKFTMNGLPMVIANLNKAIEPGKATTKLPLQSLTLEKELMTAEELSTVVKFCADGVNELNNVGPEASDDFDDLTGLTITNGRPFVRQFSPSVCQFLQSFTNLRSFHGRVPLACFNSFLRLNGASLTEVHLTTNIFKIRDILLLRKYAFNLEKLEGRFVMRPEETLNPRQVGHFQSHEVGSSQHDISNATLQNLSIFSKELLRLIDKYPMPKLTRIDITGNMTVMAMQLFVGNVEFLEELYFTNNPLLKEDFSNCEVKALSDEWLEALTYVNKLNSIKTVTLRMDNEHPVEAGSFSENGLLTFLDHCLDHCPKLTDLVGEFTRIPDKTLSTRAKTYRAKGLRRLRIRNAVPYRRFENAFDTERHYFVNEGYHLMLQEQAHQQQQFFHPNHNNPPPPPANAVGDPNNDQDDGGDADDAVNPSSQARAARPTRRYKGYIFRPYPRPLSSSDESESE